MHRIAPQIRKKKISTVSFFVTEVKTVQQNKMNVVFTIHITISFYQVFYVVADGGIGA
jgi:hypothetical protein